MTGKDAVSLHDCLDGAAVEDAALRAYRDAKPRYPTVEGRLRQVLAAVEPLICAGEQERLRQQAQDAAVPMLPPGDRPRWWLNEPVDAVPLQTLLNLLDAEPPEDPVNLNAGREGYPPPQSYTIITGAGERPLTIRATSCYENDEWLILENEGIVIAKFRLSQIGGYYNSTSAPVTGTVTEGAAGGR